MINPFSFWSFQQQKVAFWLFFGMTVLFGGVMDFLSAPLINSQAPFGIISFELAATYSNALNMINSWDDEAKLMGAIGLGFDYLFLLIYSTTIALGCSIASRQFTSPNLTRIGTMLASAQIVTAISDSIENVALIKLLLGSSWPNWASIAYYFALLKFVLIIAGIFYVLASLIRMATKSLNS